MVTISLATSVIKTYLQDLKCILHRNEPLPIITLQIVKGLLFYQIEFFSSSIMSLNPTFWGVVVLHGSFLLLQKKIKEVGRHNYLKNINRAIFIV